MCDPDVVGYVLAILAERRGGGRRTVRISVDELLQAFRRLLDGAGLKWCEFPSEVWSALYDLERRGYIAVGDGGAVITPYHYSRLRELRYLTETGPMRRWEEGPTDFLLDLLRRWLLTLI